MKKKSVKKAKLWLKDQLFYAKQGAKVVACKLASLIVVSATVIILVVFIMAASLTANRVHKVYLENKVGQNTLFIKSMPDSILQGSGTAFEVKAPSGKVYTLTNRHICELANANGELSIYDKKVTGELVTKKIVQVYDKNDLCLVEGLDGYDGLTIGDDVHVGDTVFAFGYALGEAMNVAEGRVKEYGFTTLIDPSTPLEACVGPRHAIKSINFLFFSIPVCTVTLDSINTSVFIYPGNSGSAMFNSWGNVVGVFFAGNTRTNWGNAAPLKDVKSLLSKF